uniref:AAA+ ATPase domain-containing protein n=1 Tax=Leersia perrieri TaxID=77586 RepID=A0A0D9VEN0_9ORYZ
MTGPMVSASAGVMNSVIGKLTTMLSDEYNHLKSVKKGIRWLRDELSSMNAVLQRLADMEDDDIDPQTKEWRNKVRELSYDIEDCIDLFVQNHSRGDAKANFVRKGVQKMKKLWENHQIGDEIKELKARVLEEKERHDRYKIEDKLATLSQPVRLDPRAPALYEQAKNLVGIDKPREEIICWIKSEEKQLKVVSIFGTGGMGKTTLAMEVYHKIEESFDCRAVVSVSRTLDIKKLIRDILFQINKNEYERSKEWEIEQLIPTLRENLNEKRYFVLIDDIWSTDAWEHLKLALPDNNNRSRIITTTRIRDVAKSCCRDFDGHMYEAMPLSEDNSRSLFFRRLFPSEDCPEHVKEAATVILKKCDDVGDNLEDCHIEHIKHFCELKFLRIKATISKLPEQIGNLQHLETLDLERTSIEKLPASIVQLQKLVRLLIPANVPLPEGIGNLQALEVLSFINLDIASIKSINGLGELTILREIRMSHYDGDNSKEAALISSLSKLLNCSLQSLQAGGLRSSDVINSWIISCGSLPPLWRLVLFSEIPTIPSQLASLVKLTRLYIRFGGVGGLEILASLPMLLSLTLICDAPQLRQVISNQGFQRLMKFNFRSRWIVTGLMFEPGAMPKLQRLKLYLRAERQPDVHGGLVVGLHHLSALKSIALDSTVVMPALTRWSHWRIASGVQLTSFPSVPRLRSQGRLKITTCVLSNI